ncbi:putative membrane protein YdjX (TVP38/TMEM64 family) [Enterobacillus tribolii]|uniref:Putative membrane protein YdjX (TVP38/TMEM64 family) n=2 Tax=Enterobacillus tribolii TaxID=1487935 RepID=A0A370QUN0_9GAMM|nr:TVP38/TMEM64 family protein [Enterobacillus tribolii]MBW7980984.1 TVP38/TMEM64 family protein [Enterobacillus tribolii]RDK92957.1 putative membrane protein YdjX (TVP38/TMEM64 family) [Enterobacillus tribolii]
MYSNIDQLQLWVTRHGWAGIIGYIALFVAASLFLFPGSVLVIAGGVLFGVWQGTLISLLAATLASSLSFLLARYLGRDWLLARFGHSPRFQKIDTGISFYGVDFLIFTRLVPMFPYNLQNYVYGLTAIPFWRYCWISAVTMLPGTWMYSYMAHQLAVQGITWDTGVRLLACGMGIFALTWCVRRIYQRKFGGG